jgi:hypothetical protein
VNLVNEVQAYIINDLHSEPNEEDKTHEQIWNEKAEWAKTFSNEAKQILLAEKIANFEVFRDNPNPEWELNRHKAYYETRMKVVEVCKDSNPDLYKLALKTKEEGLKRIELAEKYKKDPKKQNNIEF